MRLNILLLLLGLALSGAAAEPWTLERAVEHGLQNSPAARLAQQRIVAAQAGLRQAAAAFMPALQIQSSYVRTDNPMQVFGSALNQHSASLDMLDSPPDADNLNVKGLVTVLLYTGGRNSAGRESARANTEAARQNAEAVRNALAFEVARAFHTVLKTRDFIRAIVLD